MCVRRVLLATAVVSGTMVGCVRPGAVPPTTGGHDLITQQELERVGALTLHEAVSKLRPHFLRSRAQTAHGKAPTRPIMLYVDGDKMDSVDDLRRLSVAEVKEVRFYEPQLANTYFARYNNAGGAIAVTLKKLDGSFFQNELKGAQE